MNQDLCIGGVLSLAVHTAVLLGLPAPEVEPAGHRGQAEHVTVLGVVQLASSPETADSPRFGSRDPSGAAQARPEASQALERPKVTESSPAAWPGVDRPPTEPKPAEPPPEPPEAPRPSAGVAVVEPTPRGMALPQGYEAPREPAPEPEPERRERPSGREVGPRGSEPKVAPEKVERLEGRERPAHREASGSASPAAVPGGGESRGAPQRALEASAGLRGVPGARRATRGARQSARARYLAHVLRRIQMVKFYPVEARRGRRQGTVKVRFTVLGDGSVTDVRVSRSSGQAVLDEAARSTVRRAAPFGPIPAELGVERLSIVVPIVYRLR